MMSVDHLLQQLTQLWNSNQRIYVEQLVIDSNATDSLDSQQWLEMICHEVVLREKLGERPDLNEYQTRFPHLANELGIQWAINRLMNNAETLSPAPSTIDAPKSDSYKPEPTHILGRYEIRSELGRGAIGVVFLAWDAQLKRLIAVKRLRAGLDAKPVELDRMRAEAQAIAKIKHPNIVQIFDVGSSDGLPFLVMEY